ncbi:hypothetical protein E4U43_005379 [Claviceps pusilla]|uniref:Bromo domain-containing protein n=1 Tax=Claviceps pusilla TaxID=123648 RepID=A0A9P7N3I7_9HYPO|nr:hypothetical protein E4U43_005379 [Claviceps pusilla]
MEYFSATLDYIKKKPAEFPDPENRKKRVLEELPVAPPIAPKPPTKEEAKLVKRKDHQMLNTLKLHLQPIMDQINKKYRKFRQPVIPQSQIDYLFAESDPNYVRPDITEGVIRPYEIVKDKHGNDVLRDTATGKCYFNLETTTIEERLSNGFYARPKDFLFDIKALAKDAKNIGDKERTLKANELLSNVEVDVACIENNFSSVDWDGLHRRQVQRAAQVAEKERKRKAMQSISNRVQSDLGGGANDSDSPGPLTLGETVPGSRTTARFQLRGPLSSSSLSNGQQQDERAQDGASQAAREPKTEVERERDVQMSGTDDPFCRPSAGATGQGEEPVVMGPPTKSETNSVKEQHAGLTRISQRSAVTSLPPGVSPSAVINDASSTKTSDPSTHRSSNFNSSTQLTNGNHGHRQSGENGNEGELPDTLVVTMPGQATPPAEEVWMHSQGQGLARENMAGLAGHDLTDSPMSFQSHAPRSSGLSADPGAVRASQDTPSQVPPSGRYQGSSASQPPSVEGAIDNLLLVLTDGTSGCTIEQMEQINRELMDEIWKSRHEWNRHRAVGNLSNVFNDTIQDIEHVQGVLALSQSRAEI